MSPVNRAGSVSEISPRHSFLIKNSDVFIWEAGLAGQVTVISVFAIEISKTGLKMFPYEYSSPGNRNEPFQTKELRFRNIATKVAIFVLCVHCISSFKSPESYDSRERSKFMFHWLFWFVPVTGSFEEALDECLVIAARSRAVWRWLGKNLFPFSFRPYNSRLKFPAEFREKNRLPAV